MTSSKAIDEQIKVSISTEGSKPILPRVEDITTAIATLQSRLKEQDAELLKTYRRNAWVSVVGTLFIAAVMAAEFYVGAHPGVIAWMAFCMGTTFGQGGIWVTKYYTYKKHL